MRERLRFVAELVFMLVLIPFLCVVVVFFRVARTIIRFGKN
jgi:hypothetical protein